MINFISKKIAVPLVGLSQQNSLQSYFTDVFATFCIASMNGVRTSVILLRVVATFVCEANLEPFSMKLG
jgi:hypothetical protein